MRALGTAAAAGLVALGSVLRRALDTVPSPPPDQLMPPVIAQLWLAGLVAGAAAIMAISLRGMRRAR